MDKLNIDFKSLLPYVIDAFTAVYGDEYYSIISKKINNASIFLYYDIEGLSYYLSYIKRCKRCEYAIKFLDRIGIDVQKYKKDNYTKHLDDDIEKILEYYIDSSMFGFSKDPDYWVPLRAFAQNNSADQRKLLKNKIKIINYLIEGEHNQITEENFAAFTETNEYQIILKKINELNIIYEELLSEYREWEAQLQPFEEYIEYEKKRKDDILKEKKMSMFMEIYYDLPLPVRNTIFNKTIEEQCAAVLGDIDIGSKCIIEAFRPEQIAKLYSKEVDLNDKFWIVFWQSIYLKNLGIDIPNTDMLKCNSEKDITDYLNFLRQDNIRKYLPSDTLISHISFIRERKYEEAVSEYYTTRNDFSDIMKGFDNNQNNLKTVYDIIKNKRVCILSQGATRNDNDFVSVMFYTIRSFGGGSLFNTFVHEIGHIIDQNKNGCGFETGDDFNGSFIKNPYDNAFRKYEKFNETLNDIFTMEAVELLQSQGIYLIEPKEFTLLDTSNNNTALITKKLLQPLLSKFRQQVIRAKINAKPEELTKYIGKDNFEQLVDAVNKVDYLSRNGVLPKIDTSPEDEMVKEYFEQVERVKKIYINIDNYYETMIEQPRKSR